LARKPASRGSKIAKKGAYIDVRDRILQSLLTINAKNPTNFLQSIGFFAFVGFIDGLNLRFLSQVQRVKKVDTLSGWQESLQVEEARLQNRERT